MGSIGEDPGYMSRRFEPLAIIGMALKYPQEAFNTEKFWEFLLEARSAMTPFPKERLNADAFYHPDPEHGGTFHVKGAHFLAEDPALFDSAFFNVTKEELLTLDPQQRLVMENTYHALENAGIPMTKVMSSKTSVFASGFNHDHLSLSNMDPEVTVKYKPTGTANSIISNRISWFFDLRGPSLTVDTACSSSMVSFHLAAQSLQNGDSEMAIVTGASLLEMPTDTVGMSHHGFLGAEGRCFSFDHRAEGYARGEGVGTVLVKTLRAAVRDGDTIRAIVRGTGANQDGKTQGISLPSVEAQEQLIRDVYRNAGLDFNKTMFVEAHGTGTAAGDPIEASALARVFSPSHDKTPLCVGAVKSGIGHLEGGSGVAGIIKSVLILENGIIPPNVNFEVVNPKIPAHRWNLVFPTENLPWPTDGLRRISVNSFGFGGTNAHCILDDAYHYMKEHHLSASHKTTANVPTKRQIDARVKFLKTSRKAVKEENRDLEPEFEINGIFNASHEASKEQPLKSDKTPALANVNPMIFPISAFDKDGVLRNASALAEYLATRQVENPQALLRDIAFTLSTKRSTLAWRSFVLASSIPDLTKKLSAKSLNYSPGRIRNIPTIGFVFTGQGAQYATMGCELMSHPVFRDSVKQASAYMETLWSPWSLIDELCADKEKSRLAEPEFSHPACVALQVAMVDLLISWGVVPSHVVGHSSGEIPAAYAAGKLSREAAWKVGYFRGYVSSKLARPGSMMAVGLSREQLSPHLKAVHSKHDGELRIACYNSPNNNTVSGDDALIDALKLVLDEQSVFCRKLNVKNAYHSAHMEDAATKYRELMGDLPQGHMLSWSTQMVSSVTGDRVEAEWLGGEYWVSNLVSPVRFEEALVKICIGQDPESFELAVSESSAHKPGADHVLEVGPHSALRSAIYEVIAAKQMSKAVTYLPTLNRADRSLETLLESIGKLHCNGDSVNIQAVNRSADPWDRNGKMLVDLPAYCFNHSTGTILENRLSKNLRFRSHPRHDLFGAPVLDWNAENPRFRHFLRLHENPWLSDHMVTGNCIYPGVGYLIMAIEASRQMADPDSRIVGFKLKQVSIKRALVIPETREGVETSLTMSRMDQSALMDTRIWKRFEVASFDPVGNEWIEHCTGYIKVDYEKKHNPVDGEKVAAEEHDAWRRELQEVSEVCQTPIDFSKSYEDFGKIGLSFGPLFRNLSDVKLSGQKKGGATGLITVPDVAKAMPQGYMNSHLIHPATMDSMFHLFLAAILDQTGQLTLDKASIPTFIHEAWVSANLKLEPNQSYRAHGTASLVAYEKYECCLQVWDGSVEEGRIQMSGIRLTPLDSTNMSSGQFKRMCHMMEWKPDVDFLTTKNFPPPTTLSPSDFEQESYWINRLQLASMLMINDAFSILEQEGFNAETLEGHLKKYYEWLQYWREKLVADEVTGLTYDEFKSIDADHDAKARVYHEVENHNADGAIAIRMGKEISNVLQKLVDPIQLTFGQDKILDQVYDEVVHKGDIQAHLQSYLSLLAHSRTNLKILEIGAGTGSSTKAVLEALCPLHMEDDRSQPSLAISEYMFTDISSGFFEKARDRFKDWSHIMNFKKLDVEKEAASQGFVLGQYDLIVAGNVVHATTNLHNTLANLRGLLKPGGKILMHEIVRRDLLWTPLVFGQLPGWWLSTENIRKLGPMLLPSEWDAVMRDAGFSGVDLELPSSSKPQLNCQSVLVSTAVKQGVKRTANVRLITSNNAKQADVASTLQSQLQPYELDVSTVSISDLESQTASEAIYICLLEAEQSFLDNITETDYLAIRGVLGECRGLIWVTGNPTQSPGMNIIVGLLRTVRWERELDAVNLISVAVSREDVPSEELVECIITLFHYHFQSEHEGAENSEYIYASGMLNTNRLRDCYSANNFLHSQVSVPGSQLTPFGEAGRPIKLTTSAPGQLQNLEWVTDEAYHEPLGDTQVEVEIKAVGLNFRDVMITMGEYLANSLGNEAAGIVSRVGTKVDRLKPGERVVFLGGLDTGCFHTFGRIDQDVVVPLPENISFETAAGLPCVYSTVLYGLREAAHLSKGETILIHAAAGGVGQAAIQYAKIVGAGIYATVSTLEKRQLIVSQYGIAEDHVFCSRDLTFPTAINRCTRGRGVDVILNSLSGEYLRNSWELIAPLGRFVEIGKRDAQSYGRIELTPFLRNVTMTSVELPTIMRHKPSMIGQLTADAIRLFEEGQIREATPTTILKYSQVEEGLRLLQSGKGTGKMIFVPEQEDRISLVPDLSSPLCLDPNASYILAGGLGGIGRSIARWMVSRGAKQLIFLSRSGRADSDVVRDFIEDIQRLGCRAVVFSCDIADKGSVEEVFRECAQSLPLIKGCIQCAMILKDSMFENMSYNDWQTAVKPKVKGSWNLHTSLPKNVDFFVMLSSATGIMGNKSQANYAAGNTYQDALAQHRVSQGLRGSSVDLGSILEVGFVAENIKYARHTTATLRSLREDEVHSILEYLLSQELSNSACQLIAGLSDEILYHEQDALPPSYFAFPLFTHLRQPSAVRKMASEKHPSCRAQSLLQAATTLEEAVNIVTEGIQLSKLSSLLAIPVENIDPSKSISSNGVDSLVATEFRTWLVKELGAEIPLLDITGTGTITTLSAKIATVSKLVAFNSSC